MPYDKLKPYFKLFASCIPVKGAKRSTICDVDRGDVQPIPNDLYDILTDYKNKKLEDIIADYGEELRGDIIEYFTFLENSEFGFWCSEPDRYPDMELTWDAPSIISNAIIDVNESSNHDYAKIIKQLSDLGCRALQIRCYCSLPVEKLIEIGDLTNHTTLRSLDIYVKYCDDYTVEACKKILDAGVTMSLYIHSSPSADAHYLPAGMHISYIEKKIDSSVHCGIINRSYYISNIDVFTEAQQHNTCLNRKISIDVNGDIKNCPSMTNSFGNISNTTLLKVIDREEFRSRWFIKKDQIEVCKDCEFRYVCTDCRAYLTNPSDTYSKPLKCSYNPYTATYE